MNFYFTKNLMKSEINSNSIHFNDMSEDSLKCLGTCFLNENGRDKVLVENEFFNSFMGSTYRDQFISLQYTLAESIIEKNKEVILGMWDNEVNKYIFKKAS